ncbi:hypothetical protein PVAND_003776 [Polypedilum vanderplanki]|uniref:Uncharacterized protein n=1 Tax=Polypedilum vanderplanki TaxID=319348 RepID=A0A9J6BV31_POLVA|nr:hypothetical protein PVAND_003776 [Polypedilum vanderplanki]
MSQTVKNYLLLFAQEFVDFRFAEIESIIKIFNISLKLPNVEPKNRPYWIIESCESDIKKIASRSVSLKFVAELYCSGKTLDEFHENARNYVQFINKEYSKQSFKFIVETYNLHLKLAQKIEKIESMNYLDSALGPIDLINPDNTMIYFEYHGLKNNEPKLEEIIFGKWIADGRRDLISKISLKNRKYIGNTSMDAQLSLLMANQGLCKENDLMLDCFCGTGSLLVSCALFGSYVFGFDIDYLTLHAQSKPVRAFMKTRDKDESVKANLEQYNLQDKYIDVFVGDFSNCSLHERVVFDSIICDRK